MLRNALVSYDCKTDTFKARYIWREIILLCQLQLSMMIIILFFRKQDGDWELLGINIKWDRLRVTPPENSPHAVHISSCLDDLKPGDHIEIQWRDHQESLFGTFYVLKSLRPC